MAEKAKPTVLDRLAAMKITSDTATQDGVAFATYTKPYRDQAKCQAKTLAVCSGEQTERGKADHAARW